MYKLWLFDLDGTVTQSEFGITRSVIHALSLLGINETKENVMRFIGPPLYDSFTKFYGLSDKDAKLGVKYLTVYAFSTENWNRSTEEVDALMDLFAQYLKDCVERTNKNNMRVKVIGERSRLRSDLIERINEVEETSKNNTGITFVLAVNYGSRDEITRAVRKLSSNVKDGAINPEEIDMDTISSYLDTASIPDPDLLIRTSGEERLSNFLLWQLAYSEFYFTDCLWPDFNRDELIKAIYAYTKRDRRFGGRKK